MSFFLIVHFFQHCRSRKYYKKNKIKKLLFIHLIIKLYFKRIEKLRTNYVKIRKILQLIAKTFHNNNNDSIKNLLLKLNNLKKHVCRYIYMLKFLLNITSIVIKNQSVLKIKKKSQRKKRIKFFLNVLIRF